MLRPSALPGRVDSGSLDLTCKLARRSAPACVPGLGIGGGAIRPAPAPAPALAPAPAPSTPYLARSSPSRVPCRLTGRLNGLLTDCANVSEPPRPMELVLACVDAPRARLPARGRADVARALPPAAASGSLPCEGVGARPDGSEGVAGLDDIVDTPSALVPCLETGLGTPLGAKLGLPPTLCRSAARLAGLEAPSAFASLPFLECAGAPSYASLLGPAPLLVV